MDSETNLSPLGHYASTMGPSKRRSSRSYERREPCHQTHPPHGTSRRPICSRTFDACSRQGHHCRTHLPKSQTQPSHPRTPARLQRSYGETQHHSRYRRQARKRGKTEIQSDSSPSSSSKACIFSAIISMFKPCDRVARLFRLR